MSHVGTATSYDHTNDCFVDLKDVNLAGNEFSGMLLGTWSTTADDT